MKTYLFTHKEHLVPINQKLGPCYRFLGRGKKALSIRIKPEYAACWEGVRVHWLKEAMSQNIQLDSESKFEIWVFQNSRVDVDAYIKAIQDTLQGIVYKDDKQVEKVILEKWNRKDIEVTVKVWSGE